MRPKHRERSNTVSGVGVGGGDIASSAILWVSIGWCSTRITNLKSTLPTKCYMSYILAAYGSQDIWIDARLLSQLLVRLFEQLRNLMLSSVSKPRIYHKETFSEGDVVPSWQF